MLAPTKSNLKKIEEFLKELGFSIRYEKGHFRAGHCLLEEKHIIIVNRFFDTNGRIETLLDIAGNLDMRRFDLTPEQNSLYNKMIPRKEKSLELFNQDSSIS